MDRFLEQDAGFDPDNILILWNGLENWRYLGYPLTSTTATTTMPPLTTIEPNLTKIATLAITTPKDIKEEEIRKAVLDLFVPEFIPAGDPIPIILTITNPEESQWTCDIPITFIDQEDEDHVVIWMISVTLDVGDTKVVLIDGIQMGEGGWNVKVGLKTRVILTS